MEVYEKPDTNKRTAYFLNPNEKTDSGEFIPCIAVEGVEGYHRTDWTWGTDEDIAVQCVHEKNERLGLSREDAETIVLSTMPSGAPYRYPSV